MSEMTGYGNLRSGMQRVRESSDNQERAKGFWDLCCGCCGSGTVDPVTLSLCYTWHVTLSHVPSFPTQKPVYRDSFTGQSLLLLSLVHDAPMGGEYWKQRMGAATHN